MWSAVELENLARQYWLACSIGEPVILSEAEIAETKASMANYGLKAKPERKKIKAG